MIELFKKQCKYILLVLKSKYKWFVILFALWLYRVEFMPDTGAGLGKIIQVGSLGILLLLLLKKSPKIVNRSFNKTNEAIASTMLLYFYAIVSTLWAFLPQFAFFLSFQNVVMILLIVYVFSLCKSFRALETTFVSCVILMGVFESLCIRIGNPSLTVHFLAGGSSAAMLLAYSVGEYLNIKKHDEERKDMLRNVMILAAILLLINTSGGANASASLGIGVAMFFGGKRGYAVLLVSLSLFLLANQELVDDIILTLMPGKTMEIVESGNGRDEIWRRILGYAAEKPWFGWGFACVERVDQEIFGGQSLSDAHNNYIGIYGSLGIVGCVFLGLHMIKTFFATFPHIKRVGFLGLFCAFCCACMNSYTYGFLSGKACSITIVYFMVVVLTYYYKRVKVYE